MKTSQLGNYLAKHWPEIEQELLNCNSIIKFLGNLFKFKAETIFNRKNIQYILRIKNFFQRRSWAN